MVSIPLDLPIIFALCIVLVYVGTHIGAREHAGWLWSKETALVLALATILFCIGIDGVGIWHLLTTIGH